MCVNHDRTLDIGRLHRIYPQDGWWRPAFTLGQQVNEELEVGQPVSVGITENKWGSIMLDEVSVVRSGAVRGAQITDRIDLGPHTNRAPAPEPARTADTVEVVDHPPRGVVPATPR